RTRIASGVAGLDAILEGGLVPERSYLVTGAPGTGKTLLGLHFLTAVPSSKVLFVSFSQTESHVRDDAASFGMNTANVAFLDVTAEADTFAEAQSYDIF